MSSLNELVQEYTAELGKGVIQKAYKEIMSFLSDLKSTLEANYPDYAASALYFGYMDMTYFAFTPPTLRNKKLKIAIVYLHEECRFEAWLAGNNRQIQAQIIASLREKDIGSYTLSQIQPGVDSIIELCLIDQPDFDHLDALKKQIEVKTIAFAQDMNRLLE